MKEYLCTACEWTDKSEQVITECPICGAALTEISTETKVEETVKPEKYDQDVLETAEKKETIDEDLQ